MTWREIGDRIWVRRWPFLDQTIGVVAGAKCVAVIDTRSSIGHGHALLAEMRGLTALPHLVVNTHHHWDHTLGNAAFRPCAAWGHARCAERLRAAGDDEKAKALTWSSELAADLAETPVDPPERTFETAAMVKLGGRTLELRHFGRGHTDNDIAIAIDGVVFAGDLFEQGAPPSGGDSYPFEWPATLGQLLDFGGDEAVYVPGHGEPVDAEFVRAQLAEVAFLAEAARRADPGASAKALAAAVAPQLGWPGAYAADILERALGQLRGEIE